MEDTSAKLGKQIIKLDAQIGQQKKMIEEKNDQIEAFKSQVMSTREKGNEIIHRQQKTLADLQNDILLKEKTIEALKSQIDGEINEKGKLQAEKEDFERNHWNRMREWQSHCVSPS